MKEVSRNKRKVLFVILAIVLLAVLVVILTKIFRSSDSEKFAESDSERKVEELDIESDPKPNEELDPNVKKLLEVRAEDVYSIEMEKYVNHVAHAYTVSSPEVIERIVTNLNSISIQECKAGMFYRDKRGIFLKINSCDESGKYGMDTFRVLGENQNGVQCVGLAPLNTEVAEVVEGDLDYDYIEEVYRQYDK